MLHTAIHSMDDESTQPWQIRPRELTVWAVVSLSMCLWALLNHGQPARVSELRIEHNLGERPNGRSVQVQPAAASEAWRLDINTATESELEMLPGIGRGRAKSILQERTRRGGFHSVWDLAEVRGVTKAMVQRLEPLLQVRYGRQ